jgi:Tetratricopeptide repeat
VMDLASVLSPAGVPRAVWHAAGQAGALGGPGQRQGGGVAAEVVDAALGRLGGSSLLTFSTDGGTVTVHRLVLRVIRETPGPPGGPGCRLPGAAAALQARAGSLSRAWRDRPGRRDLAGQILAVHEHAASLTGEAGSDLSRAMLRLRWWAVWFLNELGDSTDQAIQVAEALLADMEQILGPDHPDTLASRGNLANAHRDAGRAAEAIALHERTLADMERVLGPDRPDTLASRNNLANARAARSLCLSAQATRTTAHRAPDPR